MITTSPFIDSILRTNPVVALSVSGGKDGNLAAWETLEHLDKLGYSGECALWHSNLGSMEWDDAEDNCQLLAEKVNRPLYVVRRKAGGLMERFLTRWKNNVHRYTELLCAKLILPWSTPSMRFCTSELKTQVICSELKRKYPGKLIINVTGIRRDESDQRKKAEFFSINKDLISNKKGTFGNTWHPIIDTSTTTVFSENKRLGLPMAKAYWLWGADRFSCAFCIMATLLNLQAAAKCESNHAIYRELCELEVESMFSFQSSRWLSDVAPALLNAEHLERLKFAKYAQSRRDAIQKQIPKHLLFVKGKPFPQAIPSWTEAKLLSTVRKEISELQNLKSFYLEPVEIINRYTELWKAHMEAK